MILLHGGLTIEILLFLLLFYGVISMVVFYVVFQLLRMHRGFAEYVDRHRAQSRLQYWSLVILLYIAATVVVWGTVWLTSL